MLLHANERKIVHVHLYKIQKNRRFAKFVFFDIWVATWQNQQCDCAPAKTQISLGIRPVWSESSLCAQWVAKGPRFLHADSEDSDQTGRMPRLIWVFARRILTLLVLSSRGSFKWGKSSSVLLKIQLSFKQTVQILQVSQQLNRQ